MAYNGWKNNETWNVNLWINNEESFYRLAVQFGSKITYQEFAKQYLIPFGSTATPDGVEWLDDSLDYDALDEMLAEIE